MSTSNPLHVRMILNREFLNHKAPEPDYENMFNFPWQKFQRWARSVAGRLAMPSTGYQAKHVLVVSALAR